MIKLVDSEITSNKLVYNDVGILLIDNSSLVKKNMIESSHSDGIVIQSINCPTKP